jgi:hypothetical protein
MKKSKTVIRAENSHAKEDSIEGEGSYSATHRYNAGVKQSVDSGQTEALAKKAKDALTGPEASELAQAERIGKKGDPRVDPKRK